MAGDVNDKDTTDLFLGSKGEGNDVLALDNGSRVIVRELSVTERQD